MTNKKIKEENPWKTATLVLGLLCVILLAQGIHQDGLNEINNLNSTEMNESLVCQLIQGTPSWVSNNGTILTAGYKEFPTVVQDEQGLNYTINPVKDYLIKEKIHLYYATGCGWCAKQIEWFGEDNWKAYQEANLTHDCAEDLR